MKLIRNIAPEDGKTLVQVAIPGVVLAPIMRQMMEAIEDLAGIESPGLVHLSVEVNATGYYDLNAQSEGEG